MCTLLILLCIATETATNWHIVISESGFEDMPALEDDIETTDKGAGDSAIINTEPPKCTEQPNDNKNKEQTIEKEEDKYFRYVFLLYD